MLQHWGADLRFADVKCRFTAASQRQSPVTIELDFVYPIAGRHRTDELRLHGLDEK